MMYPLATNPPESSAAPVLRIGPRVADRARFGSRITLDWILTCLNDRAPGPVVFRGLDESTVSV